MIRPVTVARSSPWLLLVVLLASPLNARAPADKPGDVTKVVPSTKGRAPRVQLAILLDSSSSMGGLIDQAQTQLWKIVNEFALAKQDGRPTELQVALYEYGKNTLPAASRYIRQIVPLTDNLDKVSEELFALKANTIPGGDEWCGAAIQAAVTELSWSDSNDDLKVIVIAGNEPFTNGPVDYRKACRQSIEKGILVDTIHCGNHQTGIRQGWAEAARLADGNYISIDQNRRVARFAAPQDPEIVRLSAELNKTYVPYGERGRDGLRRQAAQDRNAEAKGGESSAQRAVTKSSRLYRNSDWDLVDAYKEGKVELSQLKKEDLPKELHDLDLEGKKAYLEKKAKERADIRTRIAKLNAERRKHIEAASRVPTAADTPELGRAARRANRSTLDEAIIDSLRKKAAKKNIQLGKEESSDRNEKPPEKEDAPEPEREKSADPAKGDS